MSRRTLLVLPALALALALVQGASAVQHERAGSRMNLLAGTFQVYPANTPFHIAHGWALDQSDPEITPQALGRYGFALAVDGRERRPDWTERVHVEDPVLGELQTRFWIHNFPAGLTGTHTFTGRWFGPCEGIVASGLDPGPCAHQNDETTATAPLTVTVVFLP